MIAVLALLGSENTFSKKSHGIVFFMLDCEMTKLSV